MFVYVGCYTESPAGKGEGIAVYRFDPDSGALSLLQTATSVPNPSFLALDASGRFLYAVNELKEGGVSAFARDPGTGELTFLNRERSYGADPCYVSLDATGRYVLVANYTSGTIAALPVGEDGRLQHASSVVQHEGSSVNPDRQEGPHAHMIASTPGGGFVLATDLGTDRIEIYRLEDGQLVSHGSSRVEPGSGPRHFAFSPDGRTLYLLNELTSTMTVFTYDGERGTLDPRHTVSALPNSFTGESTCAQVVVSPDGRFVYGSNRGHDSIAIWAVAANGDVSVVGHERTQGSYPRNFALDPSGGWLLAAHQLSDTIVTFRRDAASGTLTPAGQVTETGTPVALLFA
jgi:6-phosphogluconolactonase